MNTGQGANSATNAIPPVHRLAELAQHLNIRRVCKECRQSEDNIAALVYCAGCGHTFHGSCWPRYEDHESVEFTGSRCSTPSDLGLHLWMTHLHNPTQSRESLLSDLYRDRSHRWIGLPTLNPAREPDPELQVYGAPTKLFTDVDGHTFGALPRRQFARIVSFVGDTGTGKSTLIQNLIRMKSESRFEVPVVGIPAASEMSTSGGIHVYTDPVSYTTERPLLYTDCEGFNGDVWPLGNSLSASTESSGRRASATSQFSRVTRLASHMIVGSLVEREEIGGTSREMPLPIAAIPLPWAEARGDRPLMTPWTARVVETIYPRFLYIFSDVICYVTSNLKTSESDLGRLVDWAHDAHALTANQAVKPKLIYIINQDPNADLAEWPNSQIATTKMLEKWRNSPRLSDLRSLWQSRGARIDSADQLLRCYYSDLIVIFVPQFKPRRQVCGADELREVYTELYREIDRRSNLAAEHRKAATHGLSLETVSQLSISVLEQLGQDPYNPVNLRSLMEPAEQYPTNFKDHALNILVRLQQLIPPQDAVSQESSLCQDFADYLAVCAAFEIRRVAVQQELKEWYVHDLEDKWAEIIDDFGQNHCRCEETSYGKRCENFGNSHGNGHHFDLKSEERVKSGEFHSDFMRTIPDLRARFMQALKRSQARLGIHRRPDVETPAQLANIDKVFSNRTCLTCFTRTPTVVLPCKHVLCDKCGIEFGSRRARFPQVSMERCPLGCQWDVERVTVGRKPAAAGVRILSLDGGGVRGVIELAILQTVLDKVGHGIPIQELFDLVIGTSTGGIIALGLFKQHWPLEEAFSLFCRLAEKAFKARTVLKLWWHLPGAHITRKLVCDHIYKSQEFEAALKEAFTERSSLFGYSAHEARRAIKVAVVAVGDETQRPCLLTNYNREWRLNDESNSVQREERPEDELTTWEAARCTSAAPTYFEKYRHHATNRVYTDGGMQKNNPVSLADNERRFIWPDQSQRRRDLVISIGTGYSANKDGTARRWQVAEALKPLRQIGIVANIILIRHVIENSLDCQKLWQNFKESLGPDQRAVSKCHRLNVPLGPDLDPCDLDDVAAMTSMKERAVKFLQLETNSVSEVVQKEANTKMEKIARQLIATLFYFASSFDLSEYTAEGIRCKGRIQCRLNQSFGTQFESLLASTPMFRIREESGQDSRMVSLAGSWDKSDFGVNCSFMFSKECSDVTLQLSMDKGKQWEDISGFPRNLRTQYNSAPEQNLPRVPSIRAELP